MELVRVHNSQIFEKFLISEVSQIQTNLGFRIISAIADYIWAWVARF